MKTFLKAVLLVVLAVVALKMLPLTFAIGCVMAGALVVLLALGASFVAVTFVALLLLAALLSPIWLPVLALLGLITLFRKSKSSPAM